MKKKVIIITFAIPIFIVAIAIHIIRRPSDGHRKSLGHSVTKKLAREIASIKSGPPLKVNFTKRDKKYNDKNITEKNKINLIKKDVIRLHSYYLKDTDWWVKNLPQVKEVQAKIVADKRKNGLKITQKELMRPDLVLTLGILSNLTPLEVTQTDASDFELSTHQWSLLNSFAQSKDFDIMRKKDLLNSSYLSLENLEMVYGNPPPIVRGKNKVYGYRDMDMINEVHIPNESASEFDDLEL